MISASTSRRCSPSCRSCSASSRLRRSRSRPCRPFQAASATHYQTGTPDGKRPGRVVVAPRNFAERSLIDDEATAYHEGIPGHHMQLSVAQQLRGLPEFRQHAHNSGYIEGWALYAEQLGKEVGFYQDPVSDYGRLSSELFRAVRLVVDTGMHSKGWTRDQVVDFFRNRQPSMSRPFRPKPIATSRGRRRRSPTSWASSSSASCASGRKRSWVRDSTSAASMTRC